MKVCPVGFFCFDRNTFLLLVVTAIIFVVYKIRSNSDIFELEKKGIKDQQNYIINKIDENNKNIQRIKDENNDTEFAVNKDYQRVVNPLLPPERSFPHRLNRIGVPINIPTRGPSSAYQQVGALVQVGSDDQNKKILPLFGKPTYPGSRQWMYYTGTDGFTSIKLPVVNSGKDCQNEYGCQEISDGDEIEVNGYDSKFTVNKYGLDKPRYIPYIV